MSKTCLIVTGGRVSLSFAKNFLQNRQYDQVIAVDSGLDILNELQMVPDDIVGDLDSVDPAVLSAFQKLPGIHFEIHRPEKDETDTELALLTAASAGCDSVDLLGALGGRMDHAIGNIQLMYQFHQRGMNIVIYDAQNKMYLLDQGMTFRKEELYGKYLSFLPMTEIVTGLTLRGFKYPLENKTIHLGTSLCISNELSQEEGQMAMESGVLLCVEALD